jgi:uncharacterized protein (DUF1800 family)
VTAASDPQAASVALNRFGLGVRPDEAMPSDPKAWLLAQFDRYVVLPSAWAGEPASASLLVAYGEYLRGLRQADAGNEQAARQKLQSVTQERYRSAVNARVTSALTTATPFAERLVHFWANHFAVSTDKTPIGTLAGAFEVEAIRPHLFGRFEDMLLAVERHPAMLLYLDQARSTGPNSAFARRRALANPERQRGLNENLAREILELHTLGVRSGYEQADVIELARALTGWSIGALPGVPPGGPSGAFTFHAMMHEAGPRTVLGRRYSEYGEAQAQAILHDLATAPATAQHVALKLARHFVADTPPPALVQRLADAYLRSRGNLSTMYQALIAAPEAWSAQQPKFKTPWEWTISLLRGLNRREPGAQQQFAPLLTQLGQPVWRPGSPAGYDDTADSWAAPDSLMRRVEFAQRVAARADGSVDARVVGPQLIPTGLSEATEHAIARADNASTALALLLVSPEFLRR